MKYEVFQLRGIWYIVVSQHNNKINAIKHYNKYFSSPDKIHKMGKRWVILQKANKDIISKAERLLQKK